MMLRNWSWMQNELPAALFRLLLSVLLLLGLRLAMPVIDAPAQAQLVSVLYSAGGIVALLLLAPLCHASLRRVAVCSGIVTLIVIAFILTDPVSRTAAARLPHLAIVVFLLATTFGIVARHLAASIVVGIVLFLTLMPIWAGPLLEFLNNPDWANRLVIFGSPLSAFATALNFDYLRTPWFYEHSAISSMRYAYPNYTSCVLFSALVPAAALIHRLTAAFPIFRPTSEAST